MGAAVPNDFPDWARANLTRQILGTISVGPNTTSPVNNFPLQIGTLAVAFQANTQPAPPNNVTITGHTTGNVYFNGSPGSLFTSRFIDPKIDPSIDVTITSPLALGSFVTFMAVQVAENVFVRNSAGEPIPVQTGTGGTISTVDVTDRAARLLGIVQEGASPPIWQSPNKQPQSFAFALAAGATSVVIAAVGGQTVRLFSISRMMPNGSGGSFGEWQTTAGVTLDNEDLSGVIAQNTWELFGSPLPIGVGLQFKNTSAVAMGFVYQGAVCYSQG